MDDNNITLKQNVNNEKEVIFIPADGNYVRILGHVIDGYDSFEAFVEHLQKYSVMEDRINKCLEFIDFQMPRRHDGKSTREMLNIMKKILGG